MLSESQGPPSNLAAIFQINISQGGVPKEAIPQGEVTSLGLKGDQHAHPDIHGGPQAALCLYSLERIQALQAEGHPIFPGSIGENLTLIGLDWSLVIPGVRLRLGGGVLVEITHFTTPCNTIVDSFLEGNYARVSQSRHPGWSRVYASVLHTGWIRAGDPVKIHNT